ncbi:unnamed protein product, partial [Brachionus calyciflorus]
KYTVKDNQIQIPINCHKFYGDILVMIFHAKSLLGTEKVMTTKICQFQFHTSFAYNDLNSNNQLKFNKNQLDCLDAPDKYPDQFHILASIEYKNIESPIASEDPWNNTLEFESQIRKIPKNLLFTNQEEMSQLIKVYDSDKYSDTTTTVTPNINIEQAQESFIPNYPSENESYEQLAASQNSGYSSRSSRSNSPRPKEDTKQPKVANLLDFDDFTQPEPQSNQESNQTHFQETKPANDFDFLLDLGPQTTTNNSNSNNLFDPFSNSSNNTNQNRNEDLLNFDAFEPIPETKNPPRPAPPNNLMFDPFGNFDISSNTTPTITSKLASSNSNSSSSFQAKLDPFADLNSFNNSIPKPQFNTQTSTGRGQSPSVETAFGKPNYNTAAFSSFPNNNNNQVPKPASTGTGLGSNKSSAIFDEFLPQNFANTQKLKNMTLKDLKREQDVKEIDPDKLKIMEWTDGKRANIRALLCSLHKVLWDEESKWKQIGMNQLVSATDVKKAYHKACLCVHPDKMTDHPQANLARMIFVELNDAWAQFQKDGQQNLF